MEHFLKIRVLSDENDHFLREYEVPAGMSLLDFNDFICDDLKLGRNALTTFFTSDCHWHKLEEFTLIEMGEDGPPTMDSVTVDELAGEVKSRLIFFFDPLIERALFLETAFVGRAADGVKYPRVARAEGQLEVDGEGSIFDEAMGEFEDFNGDDLYDDE